SGASASQGADLRKFSSQGIDALKVESSQGNIVVEGLADGAGIEVQFGQFEDPSACEAKTVVKDGRLAVDAGAKSKLNLRAKCRIEITIKAPRTLNVDLKV